MNLTKAEIKKVYRILRSFKENLLVSSERGWELDHFGQRLADRKGLDEILDKVAENIPEKDLKKLDKTILRRKYSTFRNDIDPEVKERVDQAFENRKRLKINYFKRDKGEGIERRIDIYHLNSKYAVAFCHLRGAMRKFRVSRMMKAEILDESYEIPEDFDKSKY